MTNLNQVSESYDHEQAVCESIIDQIKAAQAQINTTREYLVHIDWNELHTDVYVSECHFSEPKHKAFGVTQPSLKRILRYVNKYVKISPIGSSSPKDGNVLEVLS